MSCFSKSFYPTTGNDPEILVKHKDDLIPAEVFLPQPTSVLHADNAAIEMNTKPAGCLQQVNENLCQAILAIPVVVKRIPELSLYNCMSVRPTEKLKLRDVRMYRSVAQFGCEPSMVFQGDDLVISRPKVNPKKVLDRSIGFHVHQGMNVPGTEEFKRNYAGIKAAEYAGEILHTTKGRARLVQMCDLISGLPAVFIERDERVTVRRQVLGYGRAGEFREQPHGFEYRTLGAWPLLRPMWAWWANATVRDAFFLVLNDVDKEIKITKKIDMMAVANAIDSNDLAAALKLWVEVKKLIAPLISWDDFNLADRHPTFFANTLMMFEFIVVMGGLRFTNPENRFSFGRWANGISKSAYYECFPSKAHTLCEWNPDVLKKLKDFSSIWELTGDNLSKWL